MLLDLDFEDWDAAMSGWARSFFLSCKYALPYLLNGERARVVALDASDGEPSGLDAAWRASRGAVKETAECVAAELSNYDISVVYRKVSGVGWARDVV
jgi:NAD(P)-dependent dehydrogenase (short-subunit alcohol dehydrogenase family)